MVSRGPNDYVMCSDEFTGRQLRRRIQLSWSSMARPQLGFAGSYRTTSSVSAKDAKTPSRKETRDFLKSLTSTESAALGRLHARVLDVDDPEDSDSKWAISALQDLLEDGGQAELAWKLLRDDATTLCKHRLNRTASDLRQLLGAHGLKVRPPLPLERMGHELDASKALLQRHKPLAVLSLLSEIEQQFPACPPDRIRLYRFFQHRSAAYAQLGRSSESFEAAEIALTHGPDGLHALVIAGEMAIVSGKLDVAQQRADHAVLKHPNEPDAWILMADLASAKCRELPVPPSPVSTSAPYRIGLCNILLREGRLAEVLDATKSLLAEGARTPELLVLRARALVTNDWGDVGVFQPEVAGEVEVLTSEVVAGNAGRRDPERRVLGQIRCVAVSRASVGCRCRRSASVRVAPD